MPYAPFKPRAGRHRGRHDRQDPRQPQAGGVTEQNGRRGAVLLVEVASPSDVPRFAEPFFLKSQRRLSVQNRDEPRGAREGGARRTRQAVGVAAGSSEA
jgi:hypothetical protein